MAAQGFAHAGRLSRSGCTAHARLSGPESAVDRQTAIQRDYPLCRFSRHNRPALGRIPVFNRAIVVVAASALAALSCGRAPAADPSAITTSDQPRGTIKGHVRVMGTLPENPDIRMRADPMCETANGGRRVRFESVVAAADGS